MQPIIHFLLHASPLLVYVIVTVVLLLESSGIPIANSTLLLFTGALVSLGRLNIWALTIAALLGSTAGACLAYYIGLQGGRQVFLRLASFFRINTKKVDMLESWFQKSGVWMVFLSRIIPYIRPFTCFPAGISRMPFARFFTVAFVGSIIWCIGMLQIGVALGRRWKLALHLMQDYTIPTICLLILAAMLYFAVKYALKLGVQRAALGRGPLSLTVLGSAEGGSPRPGRGVFPLLLFFSRCWRRRVERETETAGTRPRGR